MEIDENYKKSLFFASKSFVDDYDIFITNIWTELKFMQSEFGSRNWDLLEC